MPTYEYICTGCGLVVEGRTPHPDAAEARHLIKGDDVCGTLRRNWKSVALLRENIRAVPKESS